MTANQTADVTTQASEIFTNNKFRVLDHGTKGIEIQFQIAGADGPTGGSKWFIDAASDQVRQIIARGAPGGVARRDIAGLDVGSLLTRRVDLDDETLPLAPGI